MQTSFTVSVIPLIPFVYVGEVDIPKYMQLEVYDYLYGQDNKSKKIPNHLKTLRHNQQSFDVHVPGAYLHISTKYEGFMKCCLQTTTRTQDARRTKHDCIRVFGC